MPTKLRGIALSIASLAALSLISLYLFGRGIWFPMYRAVAGERSVTEVVAAVGDDARARLVPYFSEAGVSYPPSEITLLAIKDTAQLELWAGPDTAPIFIRDYEIRALSGVAGPKLREGDRQVPEGIYQIEGLNPNSSYHLSMKLNYPNSFDLKHAMAEGRTEPGTNIFIHGKAVSIGCLAIGDPAIEELFVLVHDVGRKNVQVVISPTDPRNAALEATGLPTWVADLYRTIETEFRKHVRPET